MAGKYFQRYRETKPQAEIRMLSYERKKRGRSGGFNQKPFRYKPFEPQENPPGQY